MEFNDPKLERVDQSMQVPLANAKHMELHGRIAQGSTADHPAIESVLQINQGSIQGLHPLLAAPFDLGVRAIVSGLKDMSPKPWPVRFRELQAAGPASSFAVSQSVSNGPIFTSPAGRIRFELFTALTMSIRLSCRDASLKGST